MSEAENPVQETTWVVLNEEEGSINVTLPLGFGIKYHIVFKSQHAISSGFIALLVFTAMGCGLRTSCRRRPEETVTASAGNSLASSFPAPRPVSRPSCMNCILIEMGEMVSGKLFK